MNIALFGKLALGLKIQRVIVFVLCDFPTHEGFNLPGYSHESKVDIQSCFGTGFHECNVVFLKKKLFCMYFFHMKKAKCSFVFS